MKVYQNLGEFRVLVLSLGMCCIQWHIVIWIFSIKLTRITAFQLHSPGVDHSISVADSKSRPTKESKSEFGNLVQTLDVRKCFSPVCLCWVACHPFPAFSQIMFDEVWFQNTLSAFMLGVPWL